MCSIVEACQLVFDTGKMAKKQLLSISKFLSISIYVKVGRIYVVTLLKWTPTFEQYMARCIVKDGHQKDVI